MLQKLKLYLEIIEKHKKFLKILVIHIMILLVYKKVAFIYVLI